MKYNKNRKSGNFDIQSNRRKFLYLSTLSAATIAGVGTVSAQYGSDDEEDEAAGNDEEDEAAGNDEEDEAAGNDEEDEAAGNDEEDGTICEGSPTMSRTSITSPNSRITTDDPAVVEANFRPDPTMPEDCTIFVDLEFSFSDAGFQWGGGADWDQATSDLVVGTFEVRPGEVRDIRAQLHTQGAEAGDSVTVVADYELWFDGNRENSVQQSGIRQTIDVEEPNPPPEESEEEDTESSIPGFGFPAALAGLVGTGYLLKSKLIDDTSE